MNTKNKKIFNRARNRIIIHLEKLQKKYGEPVFSSAMRHKLIVDRQKAKAQKEIIRLQKEIEQLKRR